MRTRQEIKALAREAMREQRSVSILIVVLYSTAAMFSGFIDYLIQMTFGDIAYYIGYILGLAVLNVMMVNSYGEFVKIYKGEDARVEELFLGFKVNLLRKFGGMLWMLLWTFLWSLLLIIPGIIKSLSYHFTTNILADCPNVTATDALKVSMNITQGHKLEIFIFLLSWIGWVFLSVLTFGVLYLVYVGPYFNTANAGLYLEMREEALKDGRITLADLGMEND